MRNADSDNLDSTIKPSSRSRNVNWQLPPGVTKANWEYAQATHISSGYDEFLQDDPLTAIDRQIIARYLPGVNCSETANACSHRPIVADFGCGNGRTLAPLLRRGYRGIGIDLSLPMLNSFAKKEQEMLASGIHSPEFCRLLLLQANLVELESIGDNSVDHGISMFSTLGMIQGAKQRARFLSHVRRMIKPGGNLILHAHNAWYQVRYPGGIRSAFKSWAANFRGKSEFGDRTANYRSIQNMFIHSFQRRELANALRKSGFSELNWFGILPGIADPVEPLPIGNSFRLVGWIVVGR